MSDEVDFRPYRDGRGLFRAAVQPWSDLCAFRNRGLVEFEVGGVSRDPARSDLVEIDRFNQGFVVEGSDSERAVTPRGRLGLGATTGIVWYRPAHKGCDVKALLQ